MLVQRNWCRALAYVGSCGSISCLKYMQVPLNAQLQQTSDAGIPVVVSSPDSAAAREYQQLATKVMAKLQTAEAADERLTELGAGAPPPLI